MLTLDYSKIDRSSIEIEIDTSDAPDYMGNIIGFEYDGREATAAEIDALNEDSDYVYELCEDRLF